MQQDNNNLKFLIIIPAYNEEESIQDCLRSLLRQSKVPAKIIVVDDSSTDTTAGIVKSMAQLNPLIHCKKSQSVSRHSPGSKIINAFNVGLTGETLEDFDIICKYDADLIFPNNYLKSIEASFVNNEQLGLSGGVCTVQKNKKWITENVTNLDHVRGALKAYRKEAFIEIDGLVPQMGWDTADEFKLRFRHWEVNANPKLKVKQSKPTASSYKNTYYKKQGQVFYTLRYDILLMLIAAFKISFQRKSFKGFLTTILSYFHAAKLNESYLLSVEEGKFLRAYRYKSITKRVLNRKAVR